MSWRRWRGDLHLTLEPLARSDVPKVTHLILPKDQEDFVGPIQEMVQEPDELQEFHLARSDDTVVGFFKIDKAFSRTVTRLPAGTHGFRGLLIGAQFQGRGHGNALLMQLPSYVARHYPITDLWLAVDAGNTRATALYRRHGWIADGPQRKGRIAMEDVMRLPISTDCP